MEPLSPAPKTAASDDEPMRQNDHRRLWAPWRMHYVGAPTVEGCVFCTRLAGLNDTQSLILHRGGRAFAIMNRYPYNTGHVMLVPNEHVASPEYADVGGLVEVATMLPPTLRALRRVLHCDGFNVGLNIGADAGAGVAEHLHQHVVPRWEGDANFMPILAATMVLPELIPITYAKIRAELARELTGTDRASCVAVPVDAKAVLAVETPDGWRLPVATAGKTEPLWQAACQQVRTMCGRETSVVGWAGPLSSTETRIALTLSVSVPLSVDVLPDQNVRWVLPAETELLGPDAAIASHALSDGSSQENNP